MFGQRAERLQHGRADPWQPAPLAGSVHRPRRDGFGLERGRQLFPSSRPQVARRTSGAAHDQLRAALPEVRDLLGHASIEMTERYAHLAPERLRGAVARLEGA